MANKEKSLVDFEGPKKLPSETVAEYLLQIWGLVPPDYISEISTILDEYEDFGYTPTIQDIEKWSEEQRASLTSGVDSAFLNQLASDGENPATERTRSALKSFVDGNLSRKELVEFLLTEIADDDGLIDYINSTSMGDNWHAARIQSAIYRVNKLSASFIDSLHDPVSHLIAATIKIYEGLQAGFFDSTTIPNREDFEVLLENVQTAHTSHKQISEFYLKIGFLYRDHWWISNHQQAAIKYYELAEKRIAGSKRGANKTAEKSRALRNGCLELVAIAYAERKTAFICADVKVMADTIMEIALRERPMDYVSSPGKNLRFEWFLETLEGFRADGQLGKAIKAAILKEQGLGTT